MEALVNEGKIEKAKDVINISLENMPIDEYGYYTLVEPFIDGYYKVGETNKARDLFERLKNKYVEKLNYYYELPIEQKVIYGESILDDMTAYRRLVDILVVNNDRERGEKETLLFNEFFDKFYADHFEQEEQRIKPIDPDLDATTPVLDTSKVDALDVSEPDSVGTVLENN
jgi:hypothetical protein